MINKLHWIDRALATNKYHQDRLREDEDWTLLETAEKLGRSLGSVSEDIKIASWMKTHEMQLRQIKTAGAALAYIRKKEKELNLG